MAIMKMSVEFGHEDWFFTNNMVVEEFSCLRVGMQIQTHQGLHTISDIIISLRTDDEVYGGDATIHYAIVKLK